METKTSQLYRVFYLKSSRDLRFGQPAPAKVDLDAYTFIANVDASNLDDLFRRMNVVDGSDFEMPQKLRCRSMSVGDVAIDRDGKAHYCASFGWENVAS
jgi:hypothetical protein